MTGDEALVTAMRCKGGRAELSAADRAMIAYVDKLTLAPGTIERTDFDALKAVGFDDVGITQIAGIAAMFCYLNRMADGLGTGRG